MSVAVMENGPRSFHVQFEMRAIEDRNASIEEGKVVYKDVPFAKITMAGGKQVLDKEVNDDLLSDWSGMRGGQYDRDRDAKWAVDMFEQWKATGETQINGTDLKLWAGISPAQIKMCNMANIYSVEELAACNEEGILRIGMDGYVLKDKAKAYIDSAEDNKGAEKIAALMKEVKSLLETIDRKDDQIAELEAELEEVTGPKPKRGRPKKEG